MTWWNYHPVPRNIKTTLEPIGKIPNIIHHPEYTLYYFNHQYLHDIKTFLDSNYLNGYIFMIDYLERKLKGSISLVVMNRQNEICGFITCKVFTMNNQNIGLVDLMTVSKEHRGQGLAKVLISGITNLTPQTTQFIHKKDGDPLPFSQFSGGSYYIGILKYLQFRFGLKSSPTYPASPLQIESLLKPYTVHLDNLSNSESIRYYIIDNILFGITFWNFNYGYLLKNLIIGDIFYISKFDNLSHSAVIKLLEICLYLNIDIITSQIKLLDEFIEGKKYYWYSYNMMMPKSNYFHSPLF